MITEQQAEKALNYVKDTDSQAADLKSRYQWLDDKKKTLHAIYYMEKEGSQGNREKQAFADERYKEHLMEIKEANEAWLTVMNKRKSAELQIEMWRSMNANQRKGNI